MYEAEAEARLVGAGFCRGLVNAGLDYALITAVCEWVKNNSSFPEERICYGVTERL